MLYNLLLVLHSYTRWAVLGVAVWALVLAYTGWFGKRTWTRGDRRAGVIFASLMTVQLFLGLLLYFFPGALVLQSLGNIGAVMGVTELRFFVVEHLVGMVIAVGFAHVGTARARRATSDLAKHRQSAIWFTLTTLVVLISIPWWRPLLRGIA